MHHDYIADVFWRKGMLLALDDVLDRLQDSGSSRPWLSIGNALASGYLSFETNPKGICLRSLRNPA